jgi:uncharacterized protein YuzE
MKMRITYDSEAHASYIYFTPIGPGGVDETVAYQRMDVDLDDNDQMAALKLFESEGCRFQNRLEYALQHPEVKFDTARNYLAISFAETGREGKTVSWEANIDLDKSGQILGIEILFAHLGDGPDDHQEGLYADEKLDHMSKYF